LILYSFIAPGTCSPRSPPGCRPRSRTPTGRSSTPKISRRRPARSWPSSSTAGSAPSPTATGTYPAAIKILLTDREGLTAYLRFAAEHHNRIRHSNFIERTFGETRRRVKVIGRLPGETSCLTLVWAVLDRASRGWRGFTMTSDGLRLLQDLRRSLLEPPRQLRPHAAATQPEDQPQTVRATA
jgi:Transposase, Mutator family